MKVILLVISLFFCILSYGQSKDTLPTVVVTSYTRETRGKPFRLEVTKDTKVFDAVTKVEIPFREYEKMTKENPYNYFAEPIYDEFGLPTSFFYVKQLLRNVKNGYFGFVIPMS